MGIPEPLLKFLGERHFLYSERAVQTFLQALPDYSMSADTVMRLMSLNPKDLNRLRKSSAKVVLTELSLPMGLDLISPTTSIYEASQQMREKHSIMDFVLEIQPLRWMFDFPSVLQEELIRKMFEIGFRDGVLTCQEHTLLGSSVENVYWQNPYMPEGIVDGKYSVEEMVRARELTSISTAQAQYFGLKGPGDMIYISLEALNQEGETIRDPIPLQSGGSPYGDYVKSPDFPFRRDYNNNKIMYHDLPLQLEFNVSDVEDAFRAGSETYGHWRKRGERNFYGNTIGFIHARATLFLYKYGDKFLRHPILETIQKILTTNHINWCLFERAYRLIPTELSITALSLSLYQTAVRLLNLYEELKRFEVTENDQIVISYNKLLDSIRQHIVIMNLFYNPKSRTEFLEHTLHFGGDTDKRDRYIETVVKTK